ncbi:MAG: glycosyltransferase family 4 protein [Candidatus Omnitrophica bacterium]|nr:glycosyltransferase family 4 protein [Candidatus Omnitrophota bacterium]
MKILIIHNRYLEEGGEDRAVNAEVTLLRKFGHTVFFYERSNKEIEDFSLSKKISLVTKNIAWSKDSYREVKKLIKKEKPDIVHIHNIFILISPSIYDAFKEENIPIVQTLHNYRFVCSKGILYRNGRICEECIEGNFTPSLVHKCWRNSYFLSYFLARILKVHFKNKTFKKKIDCYIALSKFSKDKFVEAGFPEEKIFIKPNFLELDVEGKSDIYNFALFVGRLVDYKGMDTLITAFRKLDKYYLKIIGDGPLYKELKKETVSMNNIELLGKLSYKKTIEYIRKCRFVIFPSECYENLPFVIIESFACGTPVIASRLGAMEEIIEDGCTGLFFKPGDSENLATKVKWARVHKEEMQVMGEEARREYYKKYKAEKNYETLIGIYNLLVEKAKNKIVSI